jgi:hypothetical protein
VVPIPPLELLLSQADVEFAFLFGLHFGLVYESFSLARYSLSLEKAAVLVPAARIVDLVVIVENRCVVLFYYRIHIFHAAIAYTDVILVKYGLQGVMIRKVTLD